MGNEKSVERKIEIQSQPFFACSEYCAHNSRDVDLRPLTLLVFSGNESNFNVHHWKSIRHPFVVKYYDCGTFRGRKCVVTETVTPLLQVVNSLTTDELISGINNIFEALNFIHGICKLSHNCLSLNSIFVSSTTHTWKLGCFQFSSRIGEETSDSLKGLWNYCKNNSVAISPENLNAIKAITNENDIHVRDVYSLGTIIKQLFEDREIHLSENMQNLSHENPQQRPKVSSVLNDKVFEECNYLKIISFLTKFASFTEKDKEKFLETLIDRLRLISSVLLASKLIPLLLTSRVLLLHSKADEKILSYFFTPSPTATVEQPLVDETLFATHIIPIICKLYCVHKVQVRLILLRHLRLYVSYIPEETMKDYVLPQILLGLKDENDDLVSATFMALSCLVDIFGSNYVLGVRRKIFHNAIPKKYSTFNNNTDEQKFNSSPVIMVTRSEPDGVETVDTNNTTCDTNLISNVEWSEWEGTVVKTKEVQPLDNCAVEPSVQKKRGSEAFGDFDIKSMKISLPQNDEVDMLFVAMEPKFRKASSFSGKTSEKSDNMNKHSSKFDVQCDDITTENGWGEEGWE